LIKRSPGAGRGGSARTPASPVLSEQAHRRAALVVDDSRMIRKVTRGILEGLGFEVAEAENGEEALGRCKAAMPDVILLDWNMPVMSGIEFIGALRALPCGSEPKVVFCTTNSDAPAIAAALAGGADDYVLKPFTAEVLEAKLRPPQA
jgi:two-component system chemotaxis response regulator CheY